MIDSRLLQTMAAVIDYGGFERAAQQLCITQSAVSQRIKQLEEFLGQPVLIRSQPVEPTSGGRRLLQHFRQLQLMESELLQTLRPSDEPQHFTSLAIGINASSLASWFLPAITPLLTRRKLLLEVVIDEQGDTPELMRNGHVVGCISSRSQPFPGGDCRYLGAMRYRCVASPAFCQRHFPHGLNTAALAQAPAILFNGKDELHSTFLSQLGFSVHYPRYLLPSAHAFVELAVAGHAYGLLPDLMTRPALECGQLLDLTPGHHLDLALYWHHWRVESTLAQTLADVLTTAALDHLDPARNAPQQAQAFSPQPAPATMSKA